MCGIAGFYVKDPRGIDLEKLADELLLGIEHRGQDATGMLTITDGGAKVALAKDDIPATYFVQTREWLPKDVKTVLLHTRLATQGKPDKMENNHPVNFKSCFATHNGVIWNDDKLIQELDIERPAEVDSIAVPMLVATCGFSNALDNLPKLEGSWALAIVDPLTNPDELLLVRGSNSPLVVLNHPKIVIWASVQSAIKSAWEKAIGTPPAFNKYDYMDEGTAMVVDKEGNISETRFMEKPSFSGYRTSHWYRDDTEFERTFTGGSTKLCYECGTRQALFSVIDSILDKESRELTAWEVPLCWSCKEEYAGPGTLSYRFAGDDKVKLHNMKIGSKCYWCTRDNASMFTSSWNKVCEECVAFEKRHQQRPFASMKGSDPNTDTILEMKPGDPIPEEMAYAFQGCDACGGPLAEVIGEDGFAICWTCREGEMLGKARVSGVGTCMVCDNTVLAESIKDTVFGPACAVCRHTEESRAVPYAECLGCKVTFINTSLIDTTDGKFCKTCVDIDPSDIAKERDPFQNYIREAEMTTRLRFRACLETGWELNVPGHFVLWLLESCPASYFADPALAEVHVEAAKSYKENLAIIRELVQTGRDDLIEEIPLSAEAIGFLKERR